MNWKSKKSFEEILDEKLSIRKKELSTLKNIIDLSNDSEKEVLIKSWILFLYSHWEWFIKDSTSLYIRKIQETKYNINDLKVCFLKSIFFPDKTKKNHFITLLYKVVTKQFSNLENIDNEIDTSHNLNYWIFQDNILKRIWFEINILKKDFETSIIKSYGKEYLQKLFILEWESKIIEKINKKYDLSEIFKEVIKILVSFRNNIGHWKTDFTLNKEQFDFIFNITRQLMDSYKTSLINHFEKEKFLK